MNVSPDTRFDEATPDQFRAYWEAQGWTVTAIKPKELIASRLAKRLDAVFVDHCDESFIGIGNKGDSCGQVLLGHPIATFGEALRLANNLAQAELFGGWAE